MSTEHETYFAAASEPLRIMRGSADEKMKPINRYLSAALRGGVAGLPRCGAELALCPHLEINASEKRVS